MTGTKKIPSECPALVLQVAVGHLSPPVPDWASQYSQRGVTWLPPAHSFSGPGQGGPSGGGGGVVRPKLPGALQFVQLSTHTGFTVCVSVSFTWL